MIRGEDHVTNTVPQIQLFRALGAAPPAFAHLPLMVDAEGKGLSKRLGSLTLEAPARPRARADGASTTLLGRMGSSEPIEPAARSRGAGAAVFDLAGMRHGLAALRPGRARPPQCAAAARHAVRNGRPRLAALGLAATDAASDEALWLAVRGNLKRFADAAEWWRICRAEVDAHDRGCRLTTAAAGLLPPEPWNAETWRTWTAAVGQATGRKGRALFHPLRLALTGRGDGPELAALLPLIGRARALARLEGRAA